MEYSNLLISAARGKRHDFYNETVRKRRLYRQLVTGENLDKLLRRYVRREDDVLFDQRVNLTQHIVTAVCANLVKPFNKVPRSNSGRRIVGSSKSNQKNVNRVEGLLDEFWGNSSFDEWISTRLVELNQTDPNAYIVIEFGDDRKPYPYEVQSDNVMYAEYKNNVLSALVSKDEHDKGFTLYESNQTARLIPVAENTRVDVIAIDENVFFESNGRIYVYINNRQLYEYIEVLPHNLGYVPAYRVGYIRNMQNNGATCVNIFNDIEPYLLKTITLNSQFDLVATLLALPQPISYGNPCDDSKCNGGTYPNGATCNTCNGTGYKNRASSAQDEIIIKMPRSKDEMIPLSEMQAYLYPPVDIVKWQEEYIDKLTVKMRSLLFNSETFNKQQVAQTATGANIDMQNVYDTLYPFALKFSRVFKMSVLTIARINEIPDIVASYRFGRDFKFKSLNTLIQDASRANEIGNNALQRHLNNDIANIIFAEDPVELGRYKVKTSFNPFEGKTEKEIMYQLSSEFVSIETKVLYSNFGQILDDIEIELGLKGKDFYSLHRNEQRVIIDEKVSEIIKNINNNKPKLI